MVTKVNRDLFYKLASDLQEERFQAAISLVKELTNLLLPDETEEWTYVVNRLIKGLASDRSSARLGFSLCLTEVINLALSMKENAPEGLQTIDDFLQLLSKTLSLDTNANEKGALKKKKGRDERGLLFGKMFGLQAVTNEPVFSSVFLTKKDGKTEITPFAFKFMNEVVDLALKKNWIKESCLFTLFQTIQKLLPYANKDTYLSILSLLDSHNLSLTSEGLAVYLTILYGDTNDNKLDTSSIEFKNPGWKNNDPLSRGNLPLLTEVLRDSSVTQPSEGYENSKKQNASNWNPRLHFVWDILLPILISGKHTTASNTQHISKKRKKNNNELPKHIEFPEFWQMVVDESFFNEKASSERKYLGFLIFIKTIKVVSQTQLNNCFSHNFMRSLINQSTDSKRLLHKMSQNALNTIIEVCQEDSSNKLVKCVNAMVFGPSGSINFDKLTKSKTISKLISIHPLDVKTLADLFDLFTSNISEKSENKQKNRYVLDTLLHIVRTHKTGLEYDAIVTPLLDPLIQWAFFAKENEPLNELAKERFSSILAELTSVIPKEPHHSWQMCIRDSHISYHNFPRNRKLLY